MLDSRNAKHPLALVWNSSVLVLSDLTLPGITKGSGGLDPFLCGRLLWADCSLTSSGRSRGRVVITAQSAATPVWYRRLVTHPPCLTKLQHSYCQKQYHKQCEIHLHFHFHFQSTLPNHHIPYSTLENVRRTHKGSNTQV